jgi:hypothetical protein
MRASQTSRLMGEKCYCRPAFRLSTICQNYVILTGTTAKTLDSGGQGTKGTFCRTTTGRRQDLPPGNLVREINLQKIALSVNEISTLASIATATVSGTRLAFGKTSLSKPRSRQNDCICDLP